MEENILDNLKLTDEQQLLILKEWNNNEENPPSIPSLMKLIWPELGSFDARNKFGRIIKEFLITKGIKPIESGYKPKGLLELNSEQKEYIATNYSTMKSLEMARVLFKNQLLSQVSQEAKSVLNYIKTLPKINNFDNNEVINNEYTPPNTLDRVIARINKYVKDTDLDVKTLKSLQKKQCQSLIGYLHTYRFIHQINTYSKEEDRTLFESSFIKYTYDKEDLSQEDVDQYIILGTEIVMAANIQRNINQLQEEQDRQLDENDGKLSMTLVEAVNVARTEYNACIKRQQSLYKSLTEERSARLAEKVGETQSLLNLIDLWKNEDTRLQLIKIAEERKKKLSDEIDRLSSMEDIRCKLIGISKEEILNG
jgi:hypothetical protein